MKAHHKFWLAAIIISIISFTHLALNHAPSVTEPAMLSVEK